MQASLFFSLPDLSYGKWLNFFTLTSPYKTKRQVTRSVKSLHWCPILLILCTALLSLKQGLRSSEKKVGLLWTSHMVNTSSSPPVLCIDAGEKMSQDPARSASGTLELKTELEQQSQFVADHGVLLDHTCNSHLCSKPGIFYLSVASHVQHSFGDSEVTQ